MSTISSIGSSGNAWAASAPPRPPKPEQMAEKMFSTLDADGSGGISGTELEDVMGSDASALAGKLDSDGDGSITQSELTSGLQSLMPPPASTMDFIQQRGSDGSSSDSSENSELFAQLDSDGDGALSQSEFDAALQVDSGTQRTEGQRPPPPPGPPPGGGPGGGPGDSDDSSTSTSSSSDIDAIRQMLTALYAQLDDSPTSSSGTSSSSTASSTTSVSVSA